MHNFLTCLVPSHKYIHRFPPSIGFLPRDKNKILKEHFSHIYCDSKSMRAFIIWAHKSQIPYHIGGKDSGGIKNGLFNYRLKVWSQSGPRKKRKFWNFIDFGEILT